MKRPNLALNLVFCILWFLAFSRLWFSGMLAYGDTMPSPETISQAYQTFISAWQPLSRGIFYPQTMITFWQGIILIPFFKWPSFAQHIFNFLPFLLAFVFTNLLLLKITQNRVARFLASFFYAVNPGTIGTFIGGATGMLYVYSFFPALVYILWQIYDGLEQNWKKKQIFYWTLIFTLFFTLSYSFGAYTIFLLIPVCIFFACKFLWIKQFKKFLFFTAIYAGSVIFSFLLTLPFSYYTLPLISTLTGQSTAGLDVSSLFNELKASYGGDPFANIGLGGTYLNEGLKYLRWAFPLGYIIAALLFLAPWLAKDNKKKRWALIFVSVALIIFGFIYLTNQGITFQLFLKAPGFLTFRSPAKLILLLAFAYSIMLALFTEGVWDLLKKAKWRAVFCLTLLLILAIYNWPFFWGNMTLNAAKKDLGSYIIPQHFYEISNFLKDKREKEGYFRTVWLPFDYEGTELKIHWLDEEAFFLPLGWSQHGQSDINTYITTGISALWDCKDKNLGQYWAPASVKYIVLDLQHFYLKPDLQGQYINLPASQLKKCLDSQKDLEKIVEKENYLIYQNNKNLGLFSAFSQKPPEDWKMGQKLPLSLDKVNFEIKKQSPTKYIINVSAQESVYIVFSQPYHEGWQAEIDNKKLDHFSAFYLNGFYLDKTGQNSITLSYQEQKTKNILNIIFALAWLTWLGLFAWLIISTRKVIK
jgi:hypothetical protein